MSLVQPILDGDLEQFKAIDPPPNTWTYEDLVRFREEADKPGSKVIYGSYIEPDPRGNGSYALNYFAFEALPKNGIYYFTIVIPVDVKNDYAIGNSFLFTDQDSIKMWWRHTLWFYESEGKEQIPEEYIFYTCPPPPKE